MLIKSYQQLIGRIFQYVALIRADDPEATQKIEKAQELLDHWYQRVKQERLEYKRHDSGTHAMLTARLIALREEVRTHHAKSDDAKRDDNDAHE